MQMAPPATPAVLPGAQPTQTAGGYQNQNWSYAAAGLLPKWQRPAAAGAGAGYAADWVDVNAAHVYQPATPGGWPAPPLMLTHEVAPSATDDVVMATNEVLTMYATGVATAAAAAETPPGAGVATAAAAAASAAAAAAAAAAAEAPSSGGAAASGVQGTPVNSYGYGPVTVEDAEAAASHTYEYKGVDDDYWQPVSSDVCAKLDAATGDAVKCSHKTRTKGATLYFWYNKNTMKCTEIVKPKYKDDAREWEMRRVHTLVVWGRGVRNAEELQDMYNGKRNNGSVEWYYLDGGGNKDCRDERPWKAMRHSEGAVLTDALTKAGWNDASLAPVEVSHLWRNSRQVDIEDIYTMDLVKCTQQNPGPKSQTERGIRALVVRPEEPRA